MTKTSKKKGVQYDWGFSEHRWWIDGPYYILAALYTWSLLMNGVFKVLFWYELLCWFDLVIYLTIKEQKYSRLRRVKDRSGWIRVGLWWVLAVGFAILMGLNPERYPELPGQFMWTVIIVTGSYVVGRAVAWNRTMSKLRIILVSLRDLIVKLIAWIDRNAPQK